MTKAEKLLKEHQTLEDEFRLVRREFGMKEYRINDKLSFSGNDQSRNEPIVSLVITNAYEVNHSGAAPNLGLKVIPGGSGKENNIVVDGVSELIRLRNWLDDLLGDSVIQEMKEIKDEDSGSL